MNLSYPKKKDITIIAERFKIKKGEMRERLSDSLEMCFKEGEQRIRVIEQLDKSKAEPASTSKKSKSSTADIPSTNIYDFNQFYECCGVRYEEPEPRFFSFNNPFGACPVCQDSQKCMALI
ncbi:MAG: hypothetical protein IPN18_13415 [Ignavibacteriales bacterium]|nr:hypothetical protein [Ignavibacteriales bacterium]